MDYFAINSAIKAFTLNQRNVNYLFRKQNGLNKTHIEILSYANTVRCFNPYQVQQNFKQMNLQQVRLGIRKLSQVEAIEMIGSGKSGKPAVYMITDKGLRLLNDYISCWHINLV